ncbi:MAG: ABC transporter ATP-binding protein [bacterium]
MNILELTSITHRYNGREVLNISELTIKKGKTYGFVGPNGAGKTTLLSIMSLILKPTQGKLRVRGEPVRYGNAALIRMRQSMTMVLQNPYLFDMSVAKNVAYGLRARAVPQKERAGKVGDALALVGLNGFEKRRAKELSGGETQLVALARALVLDPLILFLDEPTANVDSSHMERLEGTIAAINKKHGTTIVMTTHNLTQAYRMCDEVFSLFEGSLVPSAMHNLFSGTLSVTEQGPCITTGKITIWGTGEYQPSELIHFSIDPDDIIISKEPIVSSARNHFKGIITQIVDHGGKILIEVRTEEIFKIYITQASLQEMSLTVGNEVYLTFKASSVHFFSQFTDY